MKRHSFDANEVDESRLNELKDKLKLTFAAIMRDAIKLLHQKEIQNVSKVLFVVALCIASASCGGQVPKMPINPIHVPTPTPTPVTNGGPGQVPIVRSGVVFFGDSVTARWPLATYFPGKNYVNAGIGGYDTEGLLALLPDVLSGKQVCTSITGVMPFTCQNIGVPSEIIILAGWNDILGDLDINQAAANIQQMVTLCQQAGIPVILVTIYPFDPAENSSPAGPQINANIVILDELIRNMGVTYIDLWPVFQGQSAYTVDGIHPNSAAYFQMRDAYNLVISSSLTSAQVYKNVAKTWTFEGQCQNVLADGSLSPTVTAHLWIDINPTDSTHAVWHYRKDQACAYWNPGVEQAELWFDVEEDAAGFWYSTGGIINAPFGANPVLMLPYPVNTKAGQARPYMALAASTGFSYQTLFDDVYPIGGTVLKTEVNAFWSTSSALQNVSTPFYSGPALVETAHEDSIHEIYTWAPDLELIQIACPDEGTGSPCPTMTRTQ